MYIRTPCCLVHSVAPPKCSCPLFTAFTYHCQILTTFFFFFFFFWCPSCFFIYQFYVVFDLLWEPRRWQKLLSCANFHSFILFVVVVVNNFHPFCCCCRQKLSSFLLLLWSKTFVCKLSFFHPFCCCCWQKLPCVNFHSFILFLLLVVDYKRFGVQTSILLSFLLLMINISICANFSFFHPFCCCCF